MNEHLREGTNRISTALICGLFCAIFTALFGYGLHKGYVYFASLMILFYLPATLMVYYVWTRADRRYRCSIVFINAIALTLGILLEMVAVHLDFWTFYTDIDPLLGLDIGDIPVEEYLFYFGANMQLTLLYATLRHKSESMGITAKGFWRWFNRMQDEGEIPSDEEIKRTVTVVLGVLGVIVGVAVLRRFLGGGPGAGHAARDGRGRPVYVNGRWYPGWLIAVAPFAAIGLQWFRKTLHLIHIPAFIISFAINMSLYLLFEYNAIMRGHWVYNEQRLIGWRLADTIPFEQICLYVVSFLFLVPFFESIRYVLNDIAGAKRTRPGPSVSQKRALSVSRYRDILADSSTPNAQPGTYVSS